jgi:hypothetical protein
MSNATQYCPDLLWTFGPSGDDMSQFATETETVEDQIEQDCMHVLEQEIGSNPDDPTRGVGISAVSSKMLQQNGQGFVAAAENMLQADDRVDSAIATVQVTVDPDGSAKTTMNVTIQVDDGTLQTSVLAGGVGE